MVVSTHNRAFNTQPMQLHHHQQQLENCCYFCQLEAEPSCHDDPSRILKGAEEKAAE